MLIGAGSAICGTAAVMAPEPVVKARAEQVTVAVATVVVFGTVSIFLYPMLFELTQQRPLLLVGWLLAGGALINHGCVCCSINDAIALRPDHHHHPTSTPEPKIQRKVGDEFCAVNCSIAI